MCSESGHQIEVHPVDQFGRVKSEPRKKGFQMLVAGMILKVSFINYKGDGIKHVDLASGCRSTFQI